MKRILIVEDDRTLRDVYEIIVKHAGYTVEVAANGQEGLQRIAEFKPDIILLDMLMPIKGGLELLKEANLKKTYPNVIVVVLSNLSETHTIDEALKLGAAEHLIKSNLLPSDLIEAIEKYA